MLIALSALINLCNSNNFTYQPCGHGGNFIFTESFLSVTIFILTHNCNSLSIMQVPYCLCTVFNLKGIETGLLSILSSVCLVVAFYLNLKGMSIFGYCSLEVTENTFNLLVMVYF